MLLLFCCFIEINLIVTGIKFHTWKCLLQEQNINRIDSVEMIRQILSNQYTGWRVDHFLYVIVKCLFKLLAAVYLESDNMPTKVVLLLPDLQLQTILKCSVYSILMLLTDKLKLESVGK